MPATPGCTAFCQIVNVGQLPGITGAEPRFSKPPSARFAP
jgi:hypothetical protein